MLAVIAISFLVVFGVELLGDKTLFAVSTLALRTRILALAAGLAPAFMLKMGAAVILGSYLRCMPHWLIVALSVVTFCALAVALWRRGDDRREDAPNEGWLRSSSSAFLTVFLSEWADPGQLAAAGLVVRFGTPGAVWCGSVLAMAAKAAIGIIFGRVLNRWIPLRAMRLVSISMALLLAVSCLLWDD
jgi:putative Ca2+/H+ antiporter (TMEM165/GDT1 family)